MEKLFYFLATEYRPQWWLYVFHPNRPKTPPTFLKKNFFKNLGAKKYFI
jgi:hypothetical protein